MLCVQKHNIIAFLFQANAHCAVLLLHSWGKFKSISLSKIFMECESCFWQDICPQMALHSHLWAYIFLVTLSCNMSAKRFSLSKKRIKRKRQLSVENYCFCCETLTKNLLRKFNRYTPTNAYSKRESHNIYIKTREGCEEKLAKMIVQVKANIKAEKEHLKTTNESFTLKT